MAKPVRILVVGVGNMGQSHAKAYHNNPGFELVGLMSRTIRSKKDKLAPELQGYPLYEDYAQALRETRPDAVSINTYPNTHAEYAIAAMDAGAHVFMEKPIATNIADAEAVVAKARATNRKLVLGYILRVHPAWAKFVEIGQGLGKPLVMRMNLNQQSSGPAWNWHKALMESLTPIVDCGVHYVDVMCQMTRAKPVRVHGIGAKLSAETKVQNYGHLHVTFDDGSVGWYEAGWGPMMSEVAYFVKDVWGPKGSASIAYKAQEGQNEAKADKVSDSADIDQHTKTNAIKVHHADIDANNNFTKPDTWISTEDEPNHQELCDREQAMFLKAIVEDIDLSDSMADAVNSLRIVLAAQQSIDEKRAVEL
ncbi:MAG: Gfo/Idh/MocA family oxidoreductase [Geminicoccaceae bacterium]